MEKKNPKYDVFISYRRDRGGKAADMIRKYLEKRGYRCFMDVDNLEKGNFSDQILSAIRSARYFLLILTDGSLERCCDTGKADWVRNEIAEVLRRGFFDRWLRPKDIVVPLVPEGENPVFDSNGLKAKGLELPDNIREVVNYQLHPVSLTNYFDGCMNELVRTSLGGRPYYGLWSRMCRWAKWTALALLGLCVLYFVFSPSSDKTNNQQPKAEANESASAEAAAPEADNSAKPEAAEKSDGMHLSTEWEKPDVARQKLNELDKLECRQEFPSFRAFMSNYSGWTCGAVAREDLKAIGITRKNRSIANGGAEGAVIVQTYLRVRGEVERLMGLGMKIDEIYLSRPDLSLVLLEIRLNAMRQIQKAIAEGHMEQAMADFTRMSQEFKVCGLAPMDRPIFKPLKSSAAAAATKSATPAATPSAR